MQIPAIIKNAQTELASSVRPLFFEDVYRRRINSLGSCVLASINNVKFAFTAAHVMRKDGFRNEFSEVPVGLATPAGRIISFEKSAPMFSGRLGNRPDLDIGIVQLAPELWEGNKDCHFLSANDCERDHQDDQSGQSFYLLLGYPGSRKMTKIENGEIRQRSVCIATAPAPQQRYTDLNIIAKSQILLEYNDRSISYLGRRQKPPDLAGISGGGVLNVRKNGNEARLVGIITEFLKQPGLILATRIDPFFWLSAACSAVPGLTALLGTKPKSAG